MRTKTKKKFSSFSKWAILHRKMAHSARQNDSFEEVKWAILKCKMGHFASAKNVKKIQVLCFQCFRKLSKFAYLRPQDFNFRIIDSQSTFSDFLSKEFRTVSAACRHRQQVLPPIGGTPILHLSCFFASLRICRY